MLIAVWVWAELACRSSAWHALLSGAPSCTEFWLNRYQGLIGALATLFAGFLAYRAAVSEARRADHRARDARTAMLKGEVDRLCRDIDAMRVAAGYIGKYVAHFPSTPGASDDAYFNAFQNARIKAHDVVSHSAVNAPGGYGARIQTLMTGIDRLGDRVKEQTGSSGANYNSTVALFGAEIKERIAGLQVLQKQIRDDIPRYGARLNAARDELTALEKA
jgi:hypothetical protein